MRKFILVKSETLEAVEEFAAGIENAEQLIDKVLKAARLERKEKSLPDYERLGCILGYLTTCVLIVSVAAVLIALIVW